MELRLSCTKPSIHAHILQMIAICFPYNKWKNEQEIMIGMVGAIHHNE